MTVAPSSGEPPPLLLPHTPGGSTRDLRDERGQRIRSLNHPTTADDHTRLPPEPEDVCVRVVFITEISINKRLSLEVGFDIKFYQW